MSGKERSKLRAESFINKLEQGTASLMDEEFARLERMIGDKRGCAVAHVVVAPINTAKPCNPRSSSEVSFDVHAYTEGNNEGRMDPEQGRLESPSAGTGFETPEQPCLPNWGMGRTNVDGCLLVGVSSNLGGNTFLLTELVIRTQNDSQTSTLSASSKTVFL